MRIFGFSIQKSITVDCKEHKHYRALGLLTQELVTSCQQRMELQKTFDVIEAFVSDRDKANAEVLRLLHRDFTLKQFEIALADQPHLKAQVLAAMKPKQ